MRLFALVPGAASHLIAMCVLARFTSPVPSLHGTLGKGMCVDQARLASSVVIGCPPLVMHRCVFKVLAFNGSVIVSPFAFSAPCTNLFRVWAGDWLCGG